MGLKLADGTAITNVAGIPHAAATTDPPQRITADVFEDFTTSADRSGASQGLRLRFHKGQIVPLSVLTAMFVTVTSVTPSTGPAVGGTKVTIAGANLGAVLFVTVGGRRATDVTRSGADLTVTAPAGTAGAVDVVVHGQHGTVTSAGAYTYT